MQRSTLIKWFVVSVPKRDVCFDCEARIYRFIRFTFKAILSKHLQNFAVD